MVLNHYIQYGKKWIYAVRRKKVTTVFRIHAKEVSIRDGNYVEEVEGVDTFLNILGGELENCNILGRIKND